MNTYTASHRLKITKKPTIKIHGSTDHDIFGADEVVETPVRMRKAVEQIVTPTDTGLLKVGRKHIEQEAAVEPSKGFSGMAYDPAKSDRYASTRRHACSGNVITGELVADSFENRKPSRGAVPVSGSVDHIRHAPEQAAPFVAREIHQNHQKQTRSHCPFAIDDDYVHVPEPTKPLHAHNINHGDVLTGGAMSVQHSGRRL